MKKLDTAPDGFEWVDEPTVTADAAPEGFEWADEPQASVSARGENPLPDHVQAESFFKRNYDSSIPELPLMARFESVNPQSAITAKGKLNLLRQIYPAADIDLDDYGNPTFLLGESVDGKDPAQPWYMNRPGFSPQDVNYALDLGARAGPPIVASALTGGMSLPASALAVGATGMASELGNQGLANAQGADEGYDLWHILGAGAAEMGGEVVGRAVIGPAIQKVANLFRRATGNSTAKLSELIDVKTGQIKPEVKAKLDAMGLDASDIQRMASRATPDYDSLTPTQQARTALYDSLGMTGPAAPTGGQISRDFDQMRFEADASTDMASEPAAAMRNKFVAQNERAFQVFDEAGVKGVADKAMSGQSLQAAVVENSDEVEQVFDGLYKKIREEFGDKVDVEPGALTSWILDEGDSLTVSGQSSMVPYIRDRLKKMGVIDEKGAVVGSMSIVDAENLRKTLRRDWKTSDATERAAVSEMIERLDSDVLTTAGRDYFGPARALVAEQRRYVGQSSKLSPKMAREAQAKQLMFDIYSGKVKPERIFETKVISPATTSTELAAIRDTFKTGIKSDLMPEVAKQRMADRGAQAWDNVRATTWSWLKEQAAPQSPLNSAGPSGAELPSFSGPALNRAIKKLGWDKISVLFPDEMKTLKQLSEWGIQRLPPPGAVHQTGRSSLVMGRLDKMMNFMEAKVGRIPVAGGMLGGASKLTREGAARAAVENQLAEAIEKPISSATRQNIKALPKKQKILPWMFGRRPLPPMMATGAPIAAMEGSREELEVREMLARKLGQ